jgi:DNA-binding NarL/FixJ family response regulator
LWGGDEDLEGSMAHVLIVDDHAAFRQPLAFLFNCEPDLTVVAQTGSADEGRRLLEGVDIAVVDLDLPDGTGVDLVREMRTERPHTCVLALTNSGSQDDCAKAMDAGTVKILGKSVGLDEIMRSMARLCRGVRGG